ncbi:MAG TPA: adenylyltransferase/cytidyltransferase family protein [Vicinamibacterales bacterium]|nr:adenylyltransferase/cytidyltransferase family protein [Vicinamibacterales bacterium]
MNSTTPLLSLESLAELVDAWRRDGHRTVLCHGRFDPLHYGHLMHFAEARTYGDRLLVTVTPDRFAASAPGRPYQSETVRLAMVASLRLVDAAALNRWPGAEELLQLVKPDIYVKGSDYYMSDNVAFTRETETARALGIAVQITKSFKLSATAVGLALRDREQGLTS